MKWVLTTRDGADKEWSSWLFCRVLLAVAAAIRVMEIEDVFVARMACEGQISARREKMEVLRSGISYKMRFISE